MAANTWEAQAVCHCSFNKLIDMAIRACIISD
jgi:hypothetical protein